MKSESDVLRVLDGCIASAEQSQDATVKMAWGLLSIALSWVTDIPWPPQASKSATNMYRLLDYLKKEYHKGQGFLRRSAN